MVNRETCGMRARLEMAQRERREEVEANKATSHMFSTTKTKNIHL